MTTTADELKALKREVKELQGMLAEKELKTGNGSAATHYMMTRDEIQSIANNAGKNLREFFRTKGEQIDHARASTESRIKERPFTATAIALGVGTLAGLMLRGRK